MVYNPVYKIVPGGEGSFLCPPGHPSHTHHLEGEESPRHRNLMFSGSLDYALSDKFDGPDYIKARVRKMMDAAALVESEMWIRRVYGYFRNSYAPEPKPGEKPDRNVSNAVTHNPAAIVAGSVRAILADAFANPAALPWVKEGGLGAARAESYRDGSKRPVRAARRGYEVTATGTQVYVYALADDGSRYGALPILEQYANAIASSPLLMNVRVQEPTGDEPERVAAEVIDAPEPIDPERHLAVLTIRQYFPDHTPRLDLITDPGKGYGAWPCTKCGEQVQYEAKFDKLAKVSTRRDGRGMTHWTYSTDCPQGGDHTN